MWSSSIPRLLLLTVVLTGSAIREGMTLSSLSSPDVWGHVPIGGWISEHHAIPHAGLFSQYPDLPWGDTDWGFQWLIFSAYRLFGLRAIPIFMMLVDVGIALVTFLLASAGGSTFCSAVVLSAIAQYVLPLQQPPQFVVSMLFFGVEMLLLVKSRRTGSVRHLWSLLPLFLVWANLHIEFVGGLLLLGLFLAALLIESLLRRFPAIPLRGRIRPLPLERVGLIAGLSMLCCSFTLYPLSAVLPAFKALYSNVVLRYFAEMRSLAFRTPRDFVLMLLMMAAFLALGRRRWVDAFEVLVLVACTALGFRFQRDAGFAALVAVAVLAAGFYRQQEVKSGKSWSRWEGGIATFLTAAAILIATLRLPARDVLMSKISGHFPVKACDYITRNQLPRPLFNSYTWGGFLIWYMPDYPVIVDERNDLYGDEILSRYFEAASGTARLDTDPKVAAAQTFLLERKSAMAEALVKLPVLSAQYRLAYSDQVAVVFVRQ
ncbi:MAG TPA: hypothetical protein VMI10_26385 [Terriglobales bacterium]|nr:hypothetical protein [Terriglobales bacterium]